MSIEIKPGKVSFPSVLRGRAIRRSNYPQCSLAKRLGWGEECSSWKAAQITKIECVLIGKAIDSLIKYRLMPV